jgi:hypothetical protein
MAGKITHYRLYLDVHTKPVIKTIYDHNESGLINARFLDDVYYLTIEAAKLALYRFAVQMGIQGAALDEYRKDAGVGE